MCAVVNGRWQQPSVRRRRQQQLCNDPHDVDCETTTAGASSRRPHAGADVRIQGDEATASETDTSGLHRFLTSFFSCRLILTNGFIWLEFDIAA